MAVVNGAVLDGIGIDEVDVPAGGRVERSTPTGARPGCCWSPRRGWCAGLVYPYPLDDLAGAIDRATAHYLTEGITSCQEAGIGAGLIGWSPQEYAAYALARRRAAARADDADGRGRHAARGRRPRRATRAPSGSTSGIATGLGDEWLRIGPLKIFSDGSLMGRTAAMKEPFAGEPGNSGYLQREPEELRS